MLSIDEIRAAVSHSTGVPVALLDGETEEEIRARAAALKAYAREHGGQKQSTAEQFAEWMGSMPHYDMFNDPTGSKRVLGI